MLPPVSKVEDKGELLTQAKTPQSGFSFIGDVVVGVIGPVQRSNPASVHQSELMQMRPIPTREGSVDGICQVGKGVSARSYEGSAWSRPQILTTPMYQCHVN